MSENKQEVIECLKKSLINELQAVSQYIFYAGLLKKWGVESLSSDIAKEADDESKHVNLLTGRILFLDGIPSFVVNSEPVMCGDVREILENMKNLEEQGISDLKKGINIADGGDDFISAELLMSILGEEEEHLRWLTANLNLIETIGLAAYIQKKS